MRIKNALISVYHKQGLGPIVDSLSANNTTIYSTGGTQAFIEERGIKVERVEDLTSYPSILGGRVKTLHPKVFGGILARRDNEGDQSQMKDFEIPYFDLVIVDLYPFEETVASGAVEEEIIEKIDIGGISLIRAAAKNFKDCWIISNRNQYDNALEVLKSTEGPTLDIRRRYALEAFDESSNYDTAIYRYFAGDRIDLKLSGRKKSTLRYGENPHQEAAFFGNLDDALEQIHGKPLSYNNLLDIDATVNLIREFEDTTVAIIKHNNACGLATRDTLAQAWDDALAADPVSAFGGVIAVNRAVDKETAEKMNSLFFEVLMAPEFEKDALEILKSKKNRVLLILKDFHIPSYNVRTALNGVLVQARDADTDSENNMNAVTDVAPNQEQINDLLFAAKICKHTKSNTIVLAKSGQLLASGTGQTSRVDALNQAIDKANRFGFDLNGAAMASDAFFPFPDCVEIAHKAGITCVIQPGGSIRDKESIAYCDDNKIAMVTTGIRHFKH
ncbi:bifunctional phosphoribosylaminoimidazolecarboxamide formyltransferase/IMP cyclohydrolase [Schleiferiaceae bacterium]|jgi:phosphoribosylaminoimidazolecarboxamide formyltransferase/IMP cyclohydrolase|nr:bifunctional phosphoribosylaminoimidazolecarboxamide formyltransferase/IMP cyclohydrolase [Schleiferiaceae bacterium]